MNWEKYKSDVDFLKTKGFKPKCFFYAIGGGEDENNIDIFIKGDKALTFDYAYSDRWERGSLSNCNYTNGFDNSSEIFDIYTL